jgi:hypothetical protein
VAVSFCLWSLISGFRNRVNLHLATISAAASALAGLLTVVQYSSISGFRSFEAALLFRFIDRAGLSGDVSERGLTIWNLNSYRELAHRYIEQYGPQVMLICALLFVYFLFPQFVPHLKSMKKLRRALFLFGFPVVTDHVLLINHSAIHDYASLKSAAVIAIVAVSLMQGLLLSRQANVSLAGHPGALTSSAMITRYQFAVVVVCLVTISSYLRNTHPRTPEAYTLGQEIHRDSQFQQVVFLVRHIPSEAATPNLIYFSGRNIQMVDGEEDARDFLRKHRRQEGLLFRASLDGQLVTPPVVVHPN